MAVSNNANQPWYLQGHAASNASLSELRARARRLLSSQAYLANLEKALISRTISPQIEALLYYYAYGKPVENVNLNVTQGQEDLSQLSSSELLDRLKTLQDALQEAKTLEAAIEAEVVSPTIQ